MKGFEIPRIWDAGRGSPTTEMHRGCTETRGLRMQCGQVQSSPVWGGGKFHLEGEEHLKVLKCKAENLMQSQLNFGVPIVYNTPLLPCTSGSLSFVVNQQATNWWFDSATHQRDKSMYQAKEEIRGILLHVLPGNVKKKPQKTKPRSSPFFSQADKDIIVIYSCASVHQLEAHCRRC